MIKPTAESAQHMTIVREPDYLLAIFPPYESPGQFERLFAEFYEAVDQDGHRRLLVDCRATRTQVPILDLFNLCAYVASKYAPLYPRMAVVVSPEAAYPDRFGETVLRNRGLEAIRFIRDEEEARQWLRAADPRA